MIETIAPPTTHVAGYLRLTRDESLAVGLSAPAQKKGIIEYAQRAELQPLRIYEETKAVGGDIPFEKREAGSRLLAAIKRGEVRHVIVRDLDRLTRDVGLALTLVGICKQYQLKIHTFSGVIPMRSASDLFAFQVRSAAAEFEKNQTGDRVKKAKREAVEQGRPPGGPPSYGYTSQARRRSELIAAGMGKDDAEAQACREFPGRGKMCVDEKEAEIIQLIYKLSLDGLGSRRIISYLNNSGYRTRNGCFWSTERLSRTLNNPAAAGYLTHDGDNDSGKPTPKQRQKLFRGTHEPIVDLEDWRKIQAMREARTDKIRRRGNTECVGRRYPLSGVLHCECGSPMTGQCLRGRDKAGRYVCNRRRYWGRRAINGCACKTTTINAAKVHEVFWPQLRALINSPDLVDKVYAATQRILRGQKSRKLDGRSLTQQITKLESQITIWYSRHDNTDSEIGREAAWKRIQELMAEKKRLEAAKQQKELETQTVTRITRQQIEKYLGSMGKLLNDYAGDEAKQYIRSLVEHHGLQVRMTEPETLAISLAIKSPGTINTETVTVKLEAPLSKDKITAWMNDHRGKHNCCVCGIPVEILRRHFWLGIPKHHKKCWAGKALANKRAELAGGMITGCELARRLGVGRTTIGRWIKSGKLPPPTKRIAKMLLWEDTVMKPIRRSNKQQEDEAD